MEPKLTQSQSRSVRNLIGKDLLKAIGIVVAAFPEQRVLFDEVTHLSTSLTRGEIDQDEYKAGIRALSERVLEFCVPNTRTK
jgi:hypothetical protein